jgi:hypothetical protein
MPNGVMHITYDIATKEPKAVRTEAVAWLTKGCNPVFENPKQTKLPLVDVSAPPARDVSITESKAVDV